MSKKYAPVVLFCYNRLIVLKKTIEMLQKNTLAKDTDLYIYSDGPKAGQEDNIVKIRKYLKTIDGFKSVVICESLVNKGSKNSVIEGVTEIINKYKNVIVFEDDLECSKYTLEYLNAGLERYKNEKKVYCINASAVLPVDQIPSDYKHDSYFLYRNNSSGWATWHDRWNKAIFDHKQLQGEIKDKKNLALLSKCGDDLVPMMYAQLNGGIDAWDVLWTYAIVKNNGLCLTPRYLYVSHMFDENDTHVQEAIPTITIQNISYAKKNVHISFSGECRYTYYRETQGIVF